MEDGINAQGKRDRLKTFYITNEIQKKTTEKRKGSRDPLMSSQLQVEGESGQGRPSVSTVDGVMWVREARERWEREMGIKMNVQRPRSTEHKKWTIGLSNQ